VKKSVILLLFILLHWGASFGQESPAKVVELKAKVVSSSNNLPLEGVHVINLNKVIGSITDLAGEFRINANVGDTLYITFLGFKPERVRVSNDLISLRLRRGSGSSVSTNRISRDRCAKLTHFKRLSVQYFRIEFQL
jgi:hypothetical protein